MVKSDMEQVPNSKGNRSYSYITGANINVLPVSPAALKNPTQQNLEGKQYKNTQV